MESSETNSGLQSPPSEALGTNAGDLVVPCGRDYPRYTDPPRPEREPAFAVALSGGGFRATLAGIGVLRFLAHVDLLGRVRWVSSVSGGSVANGLFARAYPNLVSSGFSAEAFSDLVERPAIERISRRSLTLKLFRNVWKTVGSPTRTTVLADALDDWFFHGTRLHQLSSQCRFVFNAANLTTGVRFGFERDVVGDYVMGNLSTEPLDLRLAEAVAASAAVPGFFAPYTFRETFPCQNDLEPRIVDGGVYENTGLEPIDHLRPDRACIVSLNAGGIFRMGPFGVIPVVRDLVRSEGLLYRQTTALRMRQMVERFKEWEEAKAKGRPVPLSSRRGVLFGLATTIPKPSTEWIELHPPPSDKLRLDLAKEKTSFARFPMDLCLQLIYRGWWLTGANLATYQRDLLPERLPTWRQTL